MKSRAVNTPAEKLLICGFGRADNEKFSRICTRIGCQAVIIAEDRGGDRVGYLAGIDSADGTGVTAVINDSCVIFSGFTGKRLDRVLREIRREFPDGIPLKAVITDANRKMTLSELIGELKRERDALAG